MANHNHRYVHTLANADPAQKAATTSTLSPAFLDNLSTLLPPWIPPGNMPYEVYSPAYLRWMPVEASYAHEVRRDRRILIRAPGVDGSNQDLHIATLLLEEDTLNTRLAPRSLD
ncbi:hypothetical protein R3P38DRAFT_3588046 [Favolaschia claudopus]|uniref:Uncharacterized protein n=1 Tax=Favolaschia claudopus TaxID=2862362 RepID=A0AAW0AI35_9AGAR